MAEAKPQQLPAVQQARPIVPVHDDGPFANLLDTAKFDHMWRVATLFSKTQMVPTHFQGHPEDCFVALQMAVRLEMDPMMFMQKSYIVGGKPGIEAQLAIALINTRGPFAGPITWEFDDENKPKHCVAVATIAKTGQEVRMPLSWTQVEAEGWAGKQGSKWRTIPAQMFRYRTAMWMGRAYCPEVLMGLYSIDELQDIGEVDANRQANGAYAAAPVEDEVEVQALLNALAEACPATAAQPPDMDSLAAYVAKCAAANRTTRTDLITGALAQAKDFYAAYFKANPPVEVMEPDASSKQQAAPGQLPLGQ